MFVHDSAGNLGKVDVTTGATTVIGNMGHVMTDIAFDPSGNLYGITFNQFYAINASTAGSTFIGNLGLSAANALVFAADGTLYAASNNTSALYTVNTSNGAASFLQSTGHSSGGDLAFNGGNLYLANGLSQLVRITLGGPSQLIGNFGVSAMFGLATGDNGTLYGVANTTVYTIDTGTGAATNGVSFAGQGLGQAYGQSFYTESGAPDPDPVPEPGTMLLVGGGLAAMLRKRRKNR
jgi:outer membrane protein assembly factor BamB